MTLVDHLWAKAEPALFISRDEFVQALDGWEVVGHDADGELAYITVTKGPEFHFQTVGRRHKLSLRAIREFLAPLIAVHGYAQTRTPLADARQQRFNELLGFEEYDRDCYDVIYRIKGMPGVLKCQ